MECGLPLNSGFPEVRGTRFEVYIMYYLSYNQSEFQMYRKQWLEIQFEMLSQCIGERIELFWVLQLCCFENTIPAKSWFENQFLDAIASLDLKLSVSG